VKIYWSRDAEEQGRGGQASEKFQVAGGFQQAVGGDPQGPRTRKSQDYVVGHHRIGVGGFAGSGPLE
jgi:hypothetical protein